MFLWVSAKAITLSVQNTPAQPCVWPCWLIGYWLFRCHTFWSVIHLHDIFDVDRTTVRWSSAHAISSADRRSCLEHAFNVWLDAACTTTQRKKSSSLALDYLYLWAHIDLRTQWVIYIDYDSLLKRNEGYLPYVVNRLEPMVMAGWERNLEVQRHCAQRWTALVNRSRNNKTAGNTGGRWLWTWRHHAQGFTVFLVCQFNSLEINVNPLH